MFTTNQLSCKWLQNILIVLAFQTYLRVELNISELGQGLFNLMEISFALTFFMKQLNIILNLNLSLYIILFLPRKKVHNLDKKQKF